MVSNFVDNTVTGTGETEAFNVFGYCDIWVLNLSSGSVKLQVKFSNEDSYRDYPDAEYSTDTASSIFISEINVMAKLVATGVGTDTYLRLSKGYEK